MSYYSDKFSDYQKEVILVNWSKETWEYHLNKHQLQNFRHASEMIKEVLLCPSIVMHGSRTVDGKNEETFCYYKEHRKINDFIDYTKVVVGCGAENKYVKSVFRKTAVHYLVVQERKYPDDFNEIWKSPNSYL